METPEEIFVAVRQLPEEEHQAYLEEVCQSPAQRSAVDALLKAAEVGDDYFAEFDATRPEIAEKPGDFIGPYKLLQKIGEGGFGVVFMAEQREPIARRVALKIIKRGMDTREVIARFEAERQALAMMDHPNIARVLDAGATETGRPYFAMELVRGKAITEFCDEQQMDPQQRLELFLDVCAAVNHAHQKGIIHRDLKPSNILVGLDGDTPIVKVIDFGIAKALQAQLTDKTLFTRFEQFVGTPLYISPEQASLSPIDVDTRSDIYSLGVLLYELIAGKPPVDAAELQSAGYDEMRRLIREKEAPKPSTRVNTASEDEQQTIALNRHTEPRKLAFLIKGDLDWVVLKALEKDRRRRYETANGLAQDLRRFLAEEPVSAVAPTATYRLRKLIRRNRIAFAMGTAVLLSLVLGLAVATWALIEEQQQRESKENALADAEASSRFLTELLGSIQEQVARGEDPVLIRRILEDAMERIEADLAGHPRVECDLKTTIGKIYDTGEDARKVLSEAVAIARSIDDEPRLVKALLALRRARPWGTAGKETIAEALEISERIHGPGHPDTIFARARLASAHIELNESKLALKQLNQAAADAEKYLNPKDPARVAVLEQQWRYTLFFEELSPHEKYRRHGVVRAGVLRIHGREHPKWAIHRDNEALHLMDLENVEPGVGHLEKAIEACEESNELTVKFWVEGHEKQVERLWLLARLYLMADRLSDAREAWKNASSYTEALAYENGDMGWRRKAVVDLLINAGMEKEALEVAMVPASFGKPSPTHNARLEADIAACLGDYERAHEVLEPKVDADDDSMLAWMQLAALRLSTGQREKYEEQRADMLKLFDEHESMGARERMVSTWSAAPWPSGSEMPGKIAAFARELEGERAFSCLAIGMAECRDGNYQEAIPFLVKASVESRLRGVRALAQVYLAMANAKLGDLEKAKSHLRLTEELLVHPVGEKYYSWSPRVFAEVVLLEVRELLAVEK